MSTLEFNKMLERNAESLRPFAITLTRDHEEARDLFQETLYRALANKDKYQVGTNIRAWLYTIMRNIFINSYRRKAKRAAIISSAPLDHHLLTGQYTAADDAMGRLQLKEIQGAIHALPELFRYPFQLYFEGYRYNEIADLLHEPLGTVKSRIHFARKLLKARVDRYGEFC
ncbi:MAG: RNA polymerase sigma factor [Chitinophagaceae bacterium]|nr:RNA polymerase sigma factor [Chitinophagaceae bacterium]